MRKTIMFAGMLLFFSMVVNAQTYVGNLPGVEMVVDKAFTTLNKPLMVFPYYHQDTDSYYDIYDSIVLYNDNLQRYKVLDYPTCTEHQINYTERVSDGEITSGDTTGHDYVHALYPPDNSYYLDLDDGGGSVIAQPIITQTLFNSDSKFEIVSPYYGGTIFSYEYTSRDYYSGDTIVYRRYHTEATGFDIFSEDGDVVASIRLGEGEYLHSGDFIIVKWGGNYYFVCAVARDGDRSSRYYFYRIDRQTQKVEQVASVPFSVRPTVMDRGQEIVVELDEGANVREIDVVNALGQTVKRVPISAGQREVRINSVDFGSGMNFINTRTVDGQATVKIIVR